MFAFLSHNHKDKHVATPLAAQLHLVGVNVWLDDWQIRPGDSIPGKVNEALGTVNTVLLLWSKNAAISRWVKSEMESALTRRIEDDSMRIIPIRLDETELPALLRSLKCLRINGAGDVERVVREIRGLGSQAELIKTIQETIDESGLTYEYFPGFGIAVGCRRCGAPSQDLTRWQETDHQRDDLYAGVRCQRCGWFEGGEI